MSLLPLHAASAEADCEKVETICCYIPPHLGSEEEPAFQEEGPPTSEKQRASPTSLSEESVLQDQAAAATVEAHFMHRTEELLPLSSTSSVTQVSGQEGTVFTPQDSEPTPSDHTHKIDQVQQSASKASALAPTLTEPVRQPLQAKIVAAAAHAAPQSRLPLVQSVPSLPRAAPSSSRIAPSTSTMETPLQQDVLRQQTVSSTPESPITFKPHPVPATITSPRLFAGGLFPPAPAAGPSLPEEGLSVPKEVPFLFAPKALHAAATQANPAKAPTPSIPLGTPTASKHLKVIGPVVDGHQDLGRLSVHMSGADSSGAIQPLTDFLTTGFSVNGGLKLKKTHGKVNSHSGVALLKQKKGMAVQVHLWSSQYCCDVLCWPVD